MVRTEKPLRPHMHAYRYSSAGPSGMIWHNIYSRVRSGTGTSH